MFKKTNIYYVNVIAVCAYISYVFYTVSQRDGYLDALLSSCIFLTLFISYALIVKSLLKAHKEKKVFVYITVPFILVFTIFHEIILRQDIWKEILTSW